MKHEEPIRRQSSPLKLTPRATERSLVFFFGIFAIVLWGFWRSYFSNPFQVTPLVHVHGFGMTLWCVMLIAQAFLIRFKRLKWHRAIGLASWLVVPANVVLMLAVVRVRLPTFSGYFEEGELTTGGHYFLGGSFADAGLFALTFVLAMVNRRNPAVHARYMVITPLPVISAATDRIIHHYFPGLATFWLDKVGAVSLEPLTFLMVDCGLLALAVYEWCKRRQPVVFARALGLFVAFQLAAIAWPYLPLTRRFGGWFLGM